MTRNFSGSFAQQETLSPDAIKSAVVVLQSGRLHCYNLAPGELGTAAVLATLFDMRIPLTFSEADCILIATIIHDVVDEVAT